MNEFGVMICQPHGNEHIVLKADPNILGVTTGLNSVSWPECACHGFLKEGSATPTFEITQFVTFHLEKRNGTRVFVTCGIPQAIKAATTAHEQVHVQNIKNKVDSLNAEYANKDYGSEEECEGAATSWRKKFKLWHISEHLHRNPESPAKTKINKHSLYQKCVAAGTCGPERDRPAPVLEGPK